MSAAESAVRVWSDYQKAIFDFVANGQGNAIVKAVAGSGKTTTIVEATRLARGQVVFLAFNKAIQVELAKRGVNAKTFHSLCFSPVKRALGGEMLEDKTDRIFNDAVDANLLTDTERRQYAGFVRRLVSLAKNSGVGCLLSDDEHVWNEIVEHHDLDLDDEGATVARAIEIARKVLAASNASPDFDFDDMLYRAVLDGVSLPTFDMVFVDEAQDTNAIRRAILRKISGDGTRIIAVGDPAQAIYGFQGADSNSLDLIADEFGCITLPLTVSYRCPQAVVRHAQQWVGHIESAPGAPEGRVTAVDSWDHAFFQKGDMVVCRTTAPIVKLAFTLLKHKIPAVVLGREIGKGMKALIKKMNAKGIDALLAKLEAHTTKEYQRFIAKKQEGKAANVRDRYEAIVNLIDGLHENERTIPALERLIDGLFSDNGSAVTLCTIHKSKGLESARVIWLNSAKCPSKWARQEWQRGQEMNLCYVATTRAISELIMIQEEGQK